MWARKPGPMCGRKSSGNDDGADSACSCLVRVLSLIRRTSSALSRFGQYTVHETQSTFSAGCCMAVPVVCLSA